MLTTHVLDTVHGQPAGGMKVVLEKQNSDGSYTVLRIFTLNKEGRCDAPLLNTTTMEKGAYRLLFDVLSYFVDRGISLPNPPFLDKVPVCFGIADTKKHYHVPLLVSPWSYSVYRGS